MKSEIYKKIESVFRNSTSQDELFDTFGVAINNKIHDFELYKILLANPVLSVEEIKMYAEKLLREITDSSYQICMWTAKIFESHSFDFMSLEDTIKYYEQAATFKPTEFEPYLNLLNLYNYEVDTQFNNKIFELADVGVNSVTLKSKVYNALSELFKKKGDLRTASRYLALAEKAAENEREMT